MGIWRHLMTWVSEFLRLTNRRRFTLDDLAIPLPAFDPREDAEARRRDVDWLRAYQGELELRLRSMERTHPTGIDRPEARLMRRYP